MTNEPRLSFSKGQDILSYISHALGYWPVGQPGLHHHVRQHPRGNPSDEPASAPVVCRCAGRILPPGRAGRPAAADLAQYVREILRYLAADKGADGVLLAVFGSRDWEEPGRAPYGWMVEAVEGALAASGKPVKHTWYVGPEHWRSYYCTDPQCCGWPGRPVSEITDSALNAELIFRGSSYESGPQTLARDAAEPLPDDVRSRIRTATETALRELAGQQCRDAQFRATLEVWEVGCLHNFRNTGRWDERIPAGFTGQRHCPGFGLGTMQRRPPAGLGRCRAMRSVDSVGLRTCASGWLASRS